MVVPAQQQHTRRTRQRPHRDGCSLLGSMKQNCSTRAAHVYSLSGAAASVRLSYYYYYAVVFLIISATSTTSTLLRFCNAFQYDPALTVSTARLRQSTFSSLESTHRLLLSGTSGSSDSAPLQDIRRRTFITSSTLLRAHGTHTDYWIDGGLRGDNTLIFGWVNCFQRRPRQLRQRPQHLQSAAIASSSKSSSTRLFMGKGDGKKKRKKKSASAGATPSSAQQQPAAQSAPAPARVSTNINIPVRKQIAWANLNKQYRAAQQSGFRQNNKKVVRTKYRRSWDEEEMEQKAEERRRRGQDPDWSVILNRTSTAPLMIVDGYNIIYKWPRLKKHMLKGDAARARRLLVDDLENLASLKHWRIECVFDGTRRSTALGPLSHAGERTTDTKAALAATKQDLSKHGVRVVYTGVGVEADTYIEGRCREAKNVTDGAITGSFIVATDDSMIRLAGQNAGALCMGADRFVQELRAVKRSVDYRVEAAVAKVNGHAIRPVQLRGRNSIMQGRFKNAAVVIQKNRTKTDVLDSGESENNEAHVNNDDSNDNSKPIEVDVQVDEDGIPWWAKVPEQPNRYKP